MKGLLDWGQGASTEDVLANRGGGSSKSVRLSDFEKLA